MTGESVRSSRSNTVAHMVWGKGGYWHAYLGGVVPVLDFAGGAVVHIATGVSVLVLSRLA